MDIEGIGAVVTGGGSGLGAAMVNEFFGKIERTNRLPRQL
jgi:NAD(P)-dependent dehydrogenase (short-subunit alcohol dehydrogenase family)